MNEKIILALIGDLYAQAMSAQHELEAAKARIAELEKERDERNQEA